MQRDMTYALDGVFSARNAGQLVGVVPSRPKIVRMHGVDVIDSAYRAREMTGEDPVVMPGQTAQRMRSAGAAQLMARPGFPRAPGLRGMGFLGFDTGSVAIIGAGALAAWLLYKLNKKS